MKNEEFNKINIAINQFISENPNWIIAIRGATATWKSGLSINLAKHYPLEILSADSRQIYKYMDIWTDKVSKEIREAIPHHLIDIIDPAETYTAGQRKHDASAHITEIHNRWNIPCVVWWTWLYIDTIYKNFAMPDVAPDDIRRASMMEQENKNPWFLFKQLQLVDPNEAMKHHPNSLRYLLRALEIYEKTGTPKSELANQQPVQWPICMIWLWREKEDTNHKINMRIKEMMQSWLIEEVQSLLERWYTLEHTAMNWIWYKEIIWYLQWEYPIEKAQELLKRNSHRYAKRQRSRFKRYIAESKQFPKENVSYHIIMLDEND